MTLLVPFAVLAFIIAIVMFVCFLIEEDLL